MSNNLKFSNSHKGFKFIKKENLNTLADLSFIEKNGLEDSLIKEDVPIFFYVKANKFCVFLSDDFLKFVNSAELFNSHVYSQNIIKEGDENYVCFAYESLDELRKNIGGLTGAFKSFKDRFDEYRDGLKSGQEVIVVYFNNKESFNGFKGIGGMIRDSEAVEKAVSGIETSFEFFKAVKFNNRYYLLKKGGEIDQESVFKMTQEDKNQHNCLVLPYDENDWKLLENINKRMIQIKNKVMNLLGEDALNNLLAYDNSKPLISFKGK